MKADLVLEHFCSIDLISQVSPDLMWEVVTRGYESQEARQFRGHMEASMILETFHGKK